MSRQVDTLVEWCSDLALCSDFEFMIMFDELQKLERVKSGDVCSQLVKAKLTKLEKESKNPKDFDYDIETINHIPSELRKVFTSPAISQLWNARGTQSFVSNSVMADSKLEAKRPGPLITSTTGKRKKS